MNFRVFRRRWWHRFCLHRVVFIFRAHAATFAEEHGKEAWIDKHDVFNYVRCTTCGKILRTAPYDHIYGESE